MYTVEVLSVTPRIRLIADIMSYTHVKLAMQLIMAGSQNVTLSLTTTKVTFERPVTCVKKKIN